MRKNLFKVLTLSVLGVVALTSCEDMKLFETTILPADAPTAIQAYVDTHFVAHTIQYIERDRDEVALRYEVYLSDNVLLEFDSDYEIKEIYSETRLPDSVIPNAILNHVEANFPDRDITDWELYRNRQEIQLDNNLEVHYDLEGTFIRIDD